MESRVCFRKYDGSVVALFVDSDRNDTWTNCTAYYRGEWGNTNPLKVVAASRPATPDEYQHIAAELGKTYTLRIVSAIEAAEPGFVKYPYPSGLWTLSTAAPTIYADLVPGAQVRVLPDYGKHESYDDSVAFVAVGVLDNDPRYQYARDGKILFLYREDFYRAVICEA
jgi:hypothetical protein